MFRKPRNAASTLAAHAPRALVTAGVAAAAAIAVVAGPMASADAAPSCSTSACITNVSLQPGGQSAGIVFDTAVPTTDHFEVSYNNAVVATADYRTAVTHHQLTSTATLEPNRTYTWLLQETDTRGHSVARAGTVSTLHRQVDVFFSTITITDDSDMAGNGELKGWDGVNGSWRANSVMPEDLGSGDTALFTDGWRVRDAGTSTSVFTEVMDNDTHNPFLPTSELPFPSSPFTGCGSTPAWDWASVKGNLATTNATAGMVPFTLGINANVGFAVHGYYSVTFVS